MKILGIHDGHNASACLLVEGRIEYAIQEERLTNIKNFIGFPEKAIKTILRLSSSNLEDLDIVAFASDYMGKPFPPRDIIEVYKREIPRGVSIKRLRKSVRQKIINFAIKHRRSSYEKALLPLKEERCKPLRKIGTPRKIVFIDHHLSHAATAYYGCPWKDENVLVLTNDGSGDTLCSAVYIGEEGKLKRIAATPMDNSLGNIYARMTFYMGMVPWEHEYKIMGLAPYASEKRVQECYEIFNKYMGIDDKNPLIFKRNTKEPTSQIYVRLARDLELKRFDWIAGGLQKFTEELLLRWVANCVKETKIKRIALAGGVFMNVKANKRILEMDEVDSLFIFPSCGDDSLSIGAAYYAYAQECIKSGKKVDIPPLTQIYFGDEFEENDIESILSQYKDKGIEWERTRDVEKRVAELLVNGKIVARCKGRMEFGARALGNRSILVDPSDLKSVREINAMIKNRDFWMPFAPTILKESEKRYLMNPKDMPSPYMIMSFDTSNMRDDIIAAIHQADFTARPQVLEETWNKEYHNIIREFSKQRGIGAILNTSFNLHGYPVVHGPWEAMWTFENSDLRYLALGDYLIWKKRT